MRVLVVAHRLELGGTQTNAIELAAEVRDRHGVEVVIAAAPGPATDLIRDRRIPFVPLSDASHHPSAVRVRELSHVGLQVRPDLVHVWDWPQCFDAYPGLHLRQRRPMLCSVMTMVVPRFLPRHLPTTFGTPSLARRAQRVRSGPVFLLEPPVDLLANDGTAVDGSLMRRAWGVAGGEVLLVAVSRLERWRKLDGLERTIDAAGVLSDEQPLKLVVVGDGSGRETLQRRADAVNARIGREVVLLAGPMVDPRPAYAAADVMVGMGGSALRTMAFGKPLVVLGDSGFSRPLDEDSIDHFIDEGYFGTGGERPDDLLGQLRRIMADPLLQERMAAAGHRVVTARYSLTDAADRLAQWYSIVGQRPVPVGRASAEAARTLSLVVGRRVASRLAFQDRPVTKETS